MLKTLRALCTAAGIAAICVPPPAAAQIADLRLPISLDADATDYDGKNSMLMFRGLRLTQGNIGIEADFGRASQLDFEDSVWQFSGNVSIDTGDGRIDCESADLRFAGHQLQLATISGSPATFELRRPGSDQVTYAQAGRLEYDFSAGIIEFSEDATITEGGNQISSNYLVYNIREQRVSAMSNGDDDDKVKVIYTPGVNGASDGNTEPAAPGEQPDESSGPDDKEEDSDTGGEQGS